MPRTPAVPIGTVDSQLHAAKRKLHDRLARRGFGPLAPPAPKLPFTALDLAKDGKHTAVIEYLSKLPTKP